MEVKVLRLDHRRQRDARITTHVCLTARALGATGVFLSGDHDKKLIENVHDVAKRWGGEFRVEYHKKWENLLNEWKNNGGEIIHLTMYGEPVQTVAPKIRESLQDKLVVVGGSRVPSKVYQEADWNVSVTTQPHSEVSSLALFLHMLYDGKELELEFEGGDMKIIPSQKGKNVKIRDKRNDDDPKLRI
ncbi:MAG TPA: tRNA (cytidine(56)-2'-O)-methyltransferase [Methanobacterium sp.]|jgi:tRNA (cytidine56-2'-O)-methyltransferase|nr:tRNA (cytidine(56)-2'-O)-methyltransferase [Methanobacterium sp.]HOI40956.1 tRNA (cytidine(56)-2'-O)-methyltransferase [Methanobacterium sp.]